MINFSLNFSVENYFASTAVFGIVEISLTKLYRHWSVFCFFYLYWVHVAAKIHSLLQLLTAKPCLKILNNGKLI